MLRMELIVAFMAYLITVNKIGAGLYRFSSIGSRFLRISHDEFSGRDIDHLFRNYESSGNHYRNLFYVIGITGNKENKKQEQGYATHTEDL